MGFSPPRSFLKLLPLKQINLMASLWLNVHQMKISVSAKSENDKNFSGLVPSGKKLHFGLWPKAPVCEKPKNRLVGLETTWVHLADSEQALQGFKA